MYRLQTFPGLRAIPRAPRTLAGLILAVCVTGCGGTNMVIDANSFPRPVIAPLPMHLAVEISPELRAYVHEERIPQFGNFRVELGAANASMLETVLPAMFETLTVVPKASEHGTTADAVLRAEIEDFQFTIPAQTRSDFFEVWIKYDMELYEPDGKLIASWPVTAYGKSADTTSMVAPFPNNAALHSAAREALRDAGAFLAIRFADVGSVRKWLLARDVDGDIIRVIGPEEDDEEMVQ